MSEPNTSNWRASASWERAQAAAASHGAQTVLVLGSGFHRQAGTGWLPVDWASLVAWRTDADDPSAPGDRAPLPGAALPLAWEGAAERGGEDFLEEPASEVAISRAWRESATCPWASAERTRPKFGARCSIASARLERSEQSSDMAPISPSRHDRSPTRVFEDARVDGVPPVLSKP